MARKHKFHSGTMYDGYIYRTPKRNEIWLKVDRDEGNSSTDPVSGDSRQKGTRYCIVVSNDTGNAASSVVEVVFTTTADKADIPTHFTVESTPVPSTVLCEQVTPVLKEDLKAYHGRLTMKEISQLNRCLKISLAL